MRRRKKLYLSAAGMLCVVCMLCLWHYTRIFRLPLERQCIKIEGKPFKVFVAKTQHQRSQGLQNIAWMPKDSGMLFVFQDAAEHCFWNKNTLMNLDLIFMRQGRVVETIRLPSIRHGAITVCPKEDVDSVLEIVAR